MYEAFDLKLEKEALGKILGTGARREIARKHLEIEPAGIRDGEES